MRVINQKLEEDHPHAMDHSDNYIDDVGMQFDVENDEGEDENTSNN